MEPMYANRAAEEALPHIPPAAQAPAIPVGTDAVAPVSLAEIVAVRQAILTGAYATADSTFGLLVAGSKRDVRRETPLRAMFEAAFHAQGPRMVAALDRWVAAEPANAAARVARGWHRYLSADAVRTGGSGRMSPEEVHAYLQGIYDAAADATAALGKDGSYLPAFWLLEYLAGVEQDPATAVKPLDLALLRSPTSFESYHGAIQDQGPRFGGSYAAIDRLALRALAGVDANPDLRIFEDFSAWVRLNAEVEEPNERGIDSLRTIVGRHPFAPYVHTLGHSLWHAGHDAEAIVWLDSALTLDPLSVYAHVTRRKYYYAAGNDSAHAADSLAVLTIDPQQPY
jgi:hypothetical protein